MKIRLILFVFLTVLLAGCSTSTKGNPGEESEVKEEDSPVSVKDWKEYLESDEYIEGHFITTPLYKAEGKNLGIKMNEEFYALDLTEQYLYLTSFIEEYYELFSPVFDELEIGYLVYIYKGDYELPTYTLGNGYYHLNSINLDISYVMSHSHEYNFVEVDNYLKKLDEVQVLNGTKAGLTKEQWDNGELPVLNATTIKNNGEIVLHDYTRYETLGEISGKLAKEAEESASENKPDSETFLDDMTGNDWVMLSKNQKFHGVSNALYNLESNGAEIHEIEQFFIDALDEFYTDGSTMYTNAIQALDSIGKMSGAITK